MVARPSTSRSRPFTAAIHELAARPDAAVLLDMEGTILFANEAWERFSALSGESSTGTLVGSRLVDAVRGDEPREVLRRLLARAAVGPLARPISVTSECNGPDLARLMTTQNLSHRCRRRAHRAHLRAAGGARAPGLGGLPGSGGSRGRLPGRRRGPRAVQLLPAHATSVGPFGVGLRAGSGGGATGRRAVRILPAVPRPPSPTRLLRQRGGGGRAGLDGSGLSYLGDRFAVRFRFLLSTRFALAVARFTLDRFDTFRLERFPSFAGMLALLCVLRRSQRGTPRGGAPDVFGRRGRGAVATPASRGPGASSAGTPR